jgi:pimeloyl-ACP methyl ester carboxylesterase
MADKSSHLRPPPLDPGTASTQSLAPSYSEEVQGRKRRLLVVYIHGFVGSEASFHTFPFHVHMKLKERLAATHAIHSKVYPRYKTYKAFHLATDNLSRWLSAHEDPNTDVVLVGHSMGGLLAEEVVLLVWLRKSCGCFQIADCQDSATETILRENTEYLA